MKKFSKNNTITWQEKLDGWKELSELEESVFFNISQKKNNNNNNNNEEEVVEEKKEDGIEDEVKKKIKLTKEDADNIIRLIKERSISNKTNACSEIINQKKVKCFNEKAIYDEYKKYWEMEKKQLSHLLDIMRNSDECVITTSSIDNKLNDISNNSIITYLNEKFKKILEKKASTSTNSTHYSLRLLSSLEAYKKLEFVDDNIEKIISFTKDNY